jgi:hypothetical protein
MRNLGILIATICCAACGGDVPSCQTAITQFYAAGCTFVNLSTNQPYTVNESILSCKDVNAAVPDRCQSYFDDYMHCLNDVKSTSQCTSCTDEQDALFGCQ